MIKIRCQNCKNIIEISIDSEEVFEITGRPKLIGKAQCDKCGTVIRPYLVIHQYKSG